MHFWVVGVGNVIGGTLVAVYWDQLGTSLALPYPKINLLESFGPASGLLLTFASLAVAMLLVHLNARRFQPKRSPAREPGQTESRLICVASTARTTPSPRWKPWRPCNQGSCWKW